MLMLGTMPSELKCASCSVGGVGKPKGITCYVAAEVDGACGACACILPVNWLPL